MSIEVRGGKELRAAFKDVGGKAAEKRLKEARAEVSIKATADAIAGARGGSALQRKMADKIRPRTTVRGAGIAIARTGKDNAAGPAFWGSTRRLGWFSDDKFAAYSPTDQKLPPWVGNNWQTAVAGQGPHRINDALAHNVNVYVETYAGAIYRAAADVGVL